MPETTGKLPVVTISIVRGKGTPAQRAAFTRFWTQLAAKARGEVKANG